MQRRPALESRLMAPPDRLFLRFRYHAPTRATNHVPAYAPVKRSQGSKCLSTAIPKDGRAQKHSPGRAYLRIYISIKGHSRSVRDRFCTRIRV